MKMGLVNTERIHRERREESCHFYMITDGDHTWPGREKGLDALNSSSEATIKASEMIWEFFRDKSLR
jgi:polyhydroxybutyrate depolymerase